MDIEASAAQQQPTTKRFRLAGMVVLAIRRFQNALNPELDIGKKKPAQPANGLPAGVSMQRSGSGRASSGRTLSGRTPEHAGKQHGYKANLLFKPLPPVPGEAETVA